MQQTVNSTANKDYLEQLNKFKVISFVPKGNSMYPMLKNKGQSVVIRKKENRLEKMDVAFYIRQNGSFVLHRVIEVTSDGYVMCGDSQFYLENVNEEQVVGVMTHFYKGKNLVTADDKYKRSVNKFYERKLLRKIRVKSFLFIDRVKKKLKRLLKKG